MEKFFLPLTVPNRSKIEYWKNFRLATRKTGRLFLLAGDQRLEHLADDFFGAAIAPADSSPEHLFRIASQAPIGVLAAHLGLIAQYGTLYKKIPYLIKLNGKTNLIKPEIQDPSSPLLTSVEQVAEFKKMSGLSVVGVGYTLYPGSAYEPQMLAEAAQVIFQAHNHGLLAVLWLYARGKSVKQPADAHLAAGLAGIAASLGADFVKLLYPNKITGEQLKNIIQAAGRSGVIFSGGPSVNPKKFLAVLAQQIKGGARGVAVGRNIHQKGLEEAIRFCRASAAVALYGYAAASAYRVYLGKEKFKK